MTKVKKYQKTKSASGCIFFYNRTYSPLYYSFQLYNTTYGVHDINVDDGEINENKDNVLGANF